MKCTPHCVTIWEYKGNSYVAFGDDVGTTYVATPPGRKAHDRRCGVLWSAKEHDGWVNKVEYVADIDSLVTCSNDGLIHFWDASEGFEPQVVRDGFGPWVEGYTEEGHQYWYNTATGESAWELPSTAAVPSWVARRAH